MLRILEISWLIVVLFGSVFGLYKTFSDGFADASYIFIITLIAFILYLIRRKERIAMQKQKEE